MPYLCGLPGSHGQVRPAAPGGGRGQDRPRPPRTAAGAGCVHTPRSGMPRARRTSSGVPQGLPGPRATRRRPAAGIPWGTNRAACGWPTVSDV